MKLNLPFLPKILEYDIQIESGKVKVVILMECIGDSLLDKAKKPEGLSETEEEHFKDWLHYTVRSMHEMTKNNAGLLNIGPELIYVKYNKATIILIP